METYTAHIDWMTPRTIPVRVVRVNTRPMWTHVQFPAIYRTMMFAEM
ncbi:hypothetical protein ACIGO9_18020 [Nocardia asteroides]